MNKKSGGILHGWTEQHHETDDLNFSVVYGFADCNMGRPWRTSVVVKINEEQTLLETRNTMYELGTPATEREITTLLSMSYG